MKLELLTLAEARDSGVFSVANLPDVYYSAAYGSTAEIVDGGTWECAVAEGGRYVLPYIRRPIPHSPGEFDLVSPYGYAGAAAPDANGRRRFRTAFRAYTRDNGGVAEFLRTNPLDITDPETDGLVADRWRTHPTFTVDLAKGGVEGYWEACEGRHRTAVRKAEKLGVTIQQTDPAELQDPHSSFRGLYRQTMERVGSSHRLKLPDDYYRRLFDGLGEQIISLQAELNGRVVAAAVLLLWNDRLHYHLSGSCSDGMRVGATNALLDHAIRQVVPMRGMLHLGGGLQAGDNLERFKRSIANRHTTVFLCSSVLNPARYRELVNELDANPDADYFPAYRA